MKKIVAVMTAASVLIVAKASIVTWNYEDNFSTEKVKSVSYDHTLFASICNFYAPALCLYPKDVQSGCLL